MTNIPVTDGLVDRGSHGQQAAQTAQGQTADGTAVKLQIAGADDAFSQGVKEYRVEIGEQSSSVRVSNNAVIGVSNRGGSVRGPEGQTKGAELQAALAKAFEDKVITPEELSSIKEMSGAISGMAAQRGRVSQTRGGGGRE